MTKKIAVFASGSGSNAENICLYFKDSTTIEVSLIVCNVAKAGVISRAERLGVELLEINNKQAADASFLEKALSQNQIDYIVLAGYLRMIPSGLISKFPNRIINIHPSLLPKYGGKGMYGQAVHQAVIQAREKESGITIHFVNEVFDDGEVIFQATIPIPDIKSPDDLAAEIHKLEHYNYPRIIEELIISK